MGVKIKVTGELKLNDSPDFFQLLSTLKFVAASRQLVPVVHHLSKAESLLGIKFTCKEVLSKRGTLNLHREHTPNVSEGTAKFGTTV